MIPLYHLNEGARNWYNSIQDKLKLAAKPPSYAPEFWSNIRMLYVCTLCMLYTNLANESYSKTRHLDLRTHYLILNGNAI